MSQAAQASLIAQLEGLCRSIDASRLVTQKREKLEEVRLMLERRDVLRALDYATEKRADEGSQIFCWPSLNRRFDAFVESEYEANRTGAEKRHKPNPPKSGYSSKRDCFEIWINLVEKAARDGGGQSYLNFDGVVRRLTVLLGDDCQSELRSYYAVSVLKTICNLSKKSVSLTDDCWKGCFEICLSVAQDERVAKSLVGSAVDALSGLLEWRADDESLDCCAALDATLPLFARCRSAPNAVDPLVSLFLRLCRRTHRWRRRRLLDAALPLAEAVVARFRPSDVSKATPRQFLLALLALHNPDCATAADDGALASPACKLIITDLFGLLFDHLRESTLADGSRCADDGLLQLTVRVFVVVHAWGEAVRIGVQSSSFLQQTKRATAAGNVTIGERRRLSDQRGPPAKQQLTEVSWTLFADNLADLTATDACLPWLRIAQFAVARFGHRLDSDDLKYLLNTIVDQLTKTTTARVLAQLFDACVAAVEKFAGVLERWQMERMFECACRALADDQRDAAARLLTALLHNRLVVAVAPLDGVLRSALAAERRLTSGLLVLLSAFLVHVDFGERVPLAPSSVGSSKERVHAFRLDTVVRLFERVGRASSDASSPLDLCPLELARALTLLCAERPLHSAIARRPMSDGGSQRSLDSDQVGVEENLTETLFSLEKCNTTPSPADVRSPTLAEVVQRVFEEAAASASHIRDSVKDDERRQSGGWIVFSFFTNWSLLTFVQTTVASDLAGTTSLEMVALSLWQQIDRRLRADDEAAKVLLTRFRQQLNQMAEQCPSASELSASVAAAILPTFWQLLNLKSSNLPTLELLEVVAVLVSVCASDDCDASAVVRFAAESDGQTLSPLLAVLTAWTRLGVNVGSLPNATTEVASVIRSCLDVGDSRRVLSLLRVAVSVGAVDGDKCCRVVERISSTVHGSKADSLAPTLVSTLLSLVEDVRVDAASLLSILQASIAACPVAAVIVFKNWFRWPLSAAQLFCCLQTLCRSVPSVDEEPSEADVTRLLALGWAVDRLLGGGAQADARDSHFVAECLFLFARAVSSGAQALLAMRPVLKRRASDLRDALALHFAYVAFRWNEEALSWAKFPASALQLSMTDFDKQFGAQSAPSAYRFGRVEQPCEPSTLAEASTAALLLTVANDRSTAFLQLVRPRVRSLSLKIIANLLARLMTSPSLTDGAEFLLSGREIDSAISFVLSALSCRTLVDLLSVVGNDSALRFLSRLSVELQCRTDLEVLQCYRHLICSHLCLKPSSGAASFLLVDFLHVSRRRFESAMKAGRDDCYLAKMVAELSASVSAAKGVVGAHVGRLLRCALPLFDAGQSHPEAASTLAETLEQAVGWADSLPQPLARRVALLRVSLVPDAEPWKRLRDVALAARRRLGALTFAQEVSCLLDAADDDIVAWLLPSHLAYLSDLATHLRPLDIDRETAVDLSKVLIGVAEVGAELRRAAVELLSLLSASFEHVVSVGRELRHLAFRDPSDCDLHSTLLTNCWRRLTLADDQASVGKYCDALSSLLSCCSSEEPLQRLSSLSLLRPFAAHRPSDVGLSGSLSMDAVLAAWETHLANESDDWAERVCLPLLRCVADTHSCLRVIVAGHMDKRFLESLFPHLIVHVLLCDKRLAPSIAQSFNTALSRLLSTDDSGRMSEASRRIIGQLVRVHMLVLQSQLIADPGLARIVVLPLSMEKLAAAATAAQLHHAAVFYAEQAVDDLTRSHWRLDERRAPLEAVGASEQREALRGVFCRASLGLRDADALHGLGQDVLADDAVRCARRHCAPGDAFSRRRCSQFLCVSERQFDKLVAVYSQAGGAALSSESFLRALDDAGVSLPTHEYTDFAYESTWKLGRWHCLDAPKNIEQCSVNAGLFGALQAATKDNLARTISIVEKIRSRTSVSESLLLDERPMELSVSALIVGRLAARETLSGLAGVCADVSAALRQPSADAIGSASSLTATRAYLMARASADSVLVDAPLRRSVVSVLSDLVACEAANLRHDKMLRKSLKLLRSWSSFLERHGLHDGDAAIVRKHVLEEAKVLWHDNERPLAQQRLRALSTTLRAPSTAVTFERDELLSRCLMQLGEFNRESSSDEGHDSLRLFQDAIGVLSESVAPSGGPSKLLGRAYKTLADYAFHGYTAAESYMKSDVYKEKEETRQRCRTEGALAKSVAETSQTLAERRLRSAARRAFSVRLYCKLMDTQFSGRNDVMERMRGYAGGLLRTAIEQYLNCLAVSSSHDLCIFRLISLWLKVVGDNDVASSIERANVATHKWVAAWRQLVSQLALFGTASAKGRAVLEKIIIETATDHPFHTFYVVYAMSGSKLAASPIRLSEQKRVGCGLLKKLQTGSRAAVFNSLTKLAEAYMETCYRTQKTSTGMSLLPKKSLLLKINADSPVQVATLTLELDPSCRYDRLTAVERFLPEVSLAAGKSAPTIVTAVCSDGKRRRQLVKGNDDVRQDAVMMQTFSVANELLARGGVRGRMRVYEVVSIGTGSGVIEWCENTVPLKVYLTGSGASGAHRKYYPQDISPAEAVLRYAALEPKKPKFEAFASVEQRVEAFDKICAQLHPVMRHFFYERYTNPVEWLARRQSYTRSVAISSMIGHVVGLGDRHAMNILLDERTAEVVHIDHGVAFEIGQLLLQIPELVPFRLTRDMLDPLGASGTEGTLRRCAERTMTVLRQSTDSLLAVLNVLLSDPAADWVLKVEQKGKSSGARAQLAATVAAKADAPGPNAFARYALSRVLDKLDGREAVDREPMNVERQVAYLISEATNVTYLSLIFRGWQPFL